MHNTGGKMQTFRSIGNLGDLVSDGRKKHGKYADVIRADRIRLENTSIGSDKKNIERKAPTAFYFSESAESFRMKYIRSHKIHADVTFLKIMLCKEYNVDIDDLESRSRKMPLPTIRKYVAFFCYYYFMFTHEEIAEIINRERSTVTTHIAEAIDDLECYPASRQRAYKIDKFLHNICKRRKHNAI